VDGHLKTRLTIWAGASRRRRSLREAVVAKLANWTLVLALAIAATGCLDFSDNEGPIMSIELFWDERPDTTTFIGGTCESAGVATMSWKLRNSHGQEVASRNEACANGIDVVDPKPGEYHLVITGKDENDDPLWTATCTGLSVLRFDVGYECDICDADHPEGCK